MQPTPRWTTFHILILVVVLVGLLVAGSAVAIWLGLGPIVHSES